MNRYIFALGTAHELCAAELLAVLHRKSLSYTIVYQATAYVIVDFPAEIPAEDLLGVLGGTIKIAEFLTQVPPEMSAIRDYISSSIASSSVTYGVSAYTQTPLPSGKIVRSIKKELDEAGIKARYVEANQSAVLSSIVVKKQQVSEYMIVDMPDGQWGIGKTIVVQDSDDWSKRDYERPHADAHAGMLPPKVARMMINIALADIQVHPIYIADPFCGMGTVMAEALMVGCGVKGSDIVATAVQKTLKNLEWLGQHYPHTAALPRDAWVCEASHVLEKYGPTSIHAIITEPFLGAAYELRGGVLYQRGKQVSAKLLKNNYKGLEKMYIGALREWHRVLVLGGTVVLVMPRMNFLGENYSVKKVIDNLSMLGYTKLAGPYTYARPQAIVKRDIYVLKQVEIQKVF